MSNAKGQRSSLDATDQVRIRFIRSIRWFLSQTELNIDYSPPRTKGLVNALGACARRPAAISATMVSR